MWEQRVPAANESCILVLGAGTTEGLEPPNLSSVSSVFSATPGHVAGLAAQSLAQSEALCLILELSKPSHSLPIPVPTPPQTPKAVSMECLCKKLAESWGWTAIPIISVWKFCLSCYVCLCCSLQCALRGTFGSSYSIDIGHFVSFLLLVFCIHVTASSCATCLTLSLRRWLHKYILGTFFQFSKG